MTNSRQAIDTIRGYYYQFDLTISQILEQKNEQNIITIEGIEDIDIASIDGNTTIQCKYYQGTTYNHSQIKDAIIFFAEHYASVKNSPDKKISYKLYGHYKSGHEKLDVDLNIDFFKKNFFKKTYYKEVKDVDGKKTKVIDKITYKNQELSFTDEDILDFISLVNIDIRGKSFEELEKHVIDQLIENLDCSEIEAEYYYNNSLAVIRELAKSKEIVSRRISKENFKKKISKSNKKIFNIWYSKIRGKSRYNKYIRKSIFDDRSSNQLRIFLIDCHGFEKKELLKTLMDISRKWSNMNISKNIELFCPYIYIHNYCENELAQIKNELIDNNYLIEDGYYYLNSSFNSKLFIREPTKNTCKYRTNLKILNNLKDLNSVLQESETKYKIIFQFYRSSPFFSSEIVLNHEIYFQDLECIKEMILW